MATAHATLACMATMSSPRPSRERPNRGPVSLWEGEWPEHRIAPPEHV